MKILFLSKLLPHPEGISGSLIVYKRMRLLSEMGHELGLLCFGDEREKPLAEQLGGIASHIRVLPPPRRRMPCLPHFCSCSVAPRLFSDVFCPAMRRAVAEMVETYGYNLVVAEFTEMGQYLFRNPLLPAVRKVVSVHACSAALCERSVRLHAAFSPKGLFLRLRRRRVTAYEFAIYAGADRVLALTGREKEILLAHDPDLRVTVVPHPVESALYAQCRSAPRENAVLFLGYFAEDTNRDAVFWFVRNVWPDLRRRFADLVFYVVGRGAGPDLLALGRRDPRIIVTGEVPDIRTYLAKARVFVCPIRIGAGFRVKILQAMAAGVPVVATSLAADGIPACTGDSIFIADTARGFRLYTALLLEDAELRQTMAGNALKIVESVFSDERAAEALDSALQDAMKAGV